MPTFRPRHRTIGLTLWRILKYLIMLTLHSPPFYLFLPVSLHMDIHLDSSTVTHHQTCDTVRDGSHTRVMGGTDASIRLREL